MRENLLVVIVLVLALVALVKPRIGLLGYLWYSLMRPDILAYAEPNSYSNILAICTVLGSVRYLPDLTVLLGNKVVRYFLLLQIPFLLSVLFAVYPELTYTEYKLHLKIGLMVLLIPLLIRTHKDMKILVGVLALSIGVIGFKFGLFGLMQGGIRFDTGYGNTSALSDNNTLALALAMAVPLLWYVRSFFDSSWARIAVWVMLLCTSAAIVMTHSRGGALSLAVAFLMVAFRSRRKVGLALMFVMLTAPAVYMVRESYFARIETIADYKTESSATARIQLAGAAVRMWEDHPLLGVGFGSLNFRRLVGQYIESETLVAHNTYLQVLVDSGIFAFLVYVGLLMGVIRFLGRSVVRMREQRPGMEVYPQALQAALVTFAVGSLFLSRVGFDYWYMLLMAAAAWRQLEGTLMEQDEPQREQDEPQQLERTSMEQGEPLALSAS